ncbi:MAG: hypothetical protein JWM38_1111 [Sphingomonas bacterium]|jgi:hypothetical protein|nr:hypothetical protein [Sphingomonas bacterium]MDB5717684.1 hypothetical protein [Sphingomonas bacterium]
MALDEMLKEHMAWIEAAARQPIFDKVGEDDVNFPQAVRERRITELSQTIDALSQQRADSDARYDAAIQSYRQEIDALQGKTQQPDTPPKPRGTPGTTRGTAKKDG